MKTIDLAKNSINLKRRVAVGVAWVSISFTQAFAQNTSVPMGEVNLQNMPLNTVKMVTVEESCANSIRNFTQFTDINKWVLQKPSVIREELKGFCVPTERKSFANPPIKLVNDNEQANLDCKLEEGFVDVTSFWIHEQNANMGNININPFCATPILQAITKKLGNPTTRKDFPIGLQWKLPKAVTSVAPILYPSIIMTQPTVGEFNLMLGLYD